MSPPGSKLVDIDRLADSRAEMDFTLPLAELLPLRSQPAACAPGQGLAGSVSGHVRFERVAGIPAAELTVRGTAQLICQRCLGPLEVPVEAQVRIGLIVSEADIDRVPGDLEPVLAPDGRTSIAALVGEEILLCLPIVPQHADDEPCVRSEVEPAKEAVPPTQRPFERLGELLGRK
jgi:uncharacterized metal-binding protein YceD (DUF177 family)